MGRVRLRFRRNQRREATMIHTDLGGQPISFEPIERDGRLGSMALVAGAAVAVTAAVARRVGGRSRRCDRTRAAARRVTA
jgi:hypothetical protein